MNYQIVPPVVHLHQTGNVPLRTLQRPVVLSREQTELLILTLSNSGQGGRGEVAPGRTFGGAAL